MTQGTKLIDYAIVGGTGIYRLASLTERENVRLDTPFGSLSSPLTYGTWGSRRVVFMARHGTDHSVAPHLINYRANIWALAQLKPRAVIAINAVGSLNPRMPPASLVLPDQVIDYTWGREHTYVGALEGIEMHTDMTWPYNVFLREALSQVGTDCLTAHTGTYGATQGPRLETPAEIRRLRQDGCDVVGMTGMPEAALAKELGLTYASIAMVANWAAGIDDSTEPITMPQVHANISAATTNLTSLLTTFLQTTNNH